MNSVNAGWTSSDTVKTAWKFLIDVALKVCLLERSTLSVLVLVICGHYIIENISVEAVKVRREGDCSTSVRISPALCQRRKRHLGAYHIWPVCKCITALHIISIVFINANLDSTAAVKCS